VAGILGAFCSGAFDSPPALLPPGFDVMIFLSSRVDSSGETSQNSSHFQGPSNPFNFTPNYLSAAEEIAQNPSKLPAKKVEKLL
jgi:hypothetical protein